MHTDPAKYQAAKQKAVEMAEQWLEVNPTDLNAKAELAGYYGELKETEKARAMLEEFGDRPTPELSSHISFQVGATWEALGERKKALVWIRDALLKGYNVNEINQYPGLEDLRSDKAFVLIMDSLQAVSSTVELASRTKSEPAMSRFITSLLSLIAIVVLEAFLWKRPSGQGIGQGKGNAHVMDLSLQFDTTPQ